MCVYVVVLSQRGGACVTYCRAPTRHGTNSCDFPSVDGRGPSGRMYGDKSTTEEGKDTS